MKKLSLILFLIIFLLAVYFILFLSESLYSGKDKVTENQKSKIILTGHRGAGGLAPENNISAIKKGLENNVDRIEIDVQQTKDKVVISLHDKTIDRTTNGKGLVKDLTYNEIIKYSSGIKFSKEFESDRIPTLEQVLAEVSGKAILVIEIKDGDEFYPGIVKRVVNSINKYNAKNWTIIHSFNDKALKKVHEIDSTIILHKLFIADFPFLSLIYDGKLQVTNLEQYTYCTEFSTFYPFTTKRLVNKVHSLGKKINVWTVNDSIKINKLINMGVDGIITDFPDYFKR
ncbi:MAG: hypothetical protein JXR51_03070 [Bacteroidales bacterium]|nr:hypothetical protein [Bacteroidales bacterium]MBN2756132.1 hypothetical protein [Bacteroidales bacterium]